MEDVSGICRAKNTLSGESKVNVEALSLISKLEKKIPWEKQDSNVNCIHRPSKFLTKLAFQRKETVEEKRLEFDKRIGDLQGRNT